MNKIILIFTLLVSSITFSQSDVEYTKTLKKMFKVSGTEENYEVAIKSVCDMFRKQYTKVDEETWDLMEKEMLSTSIDELVSMLVPVYQKYLSKTDLEEIISFYESGVGKKYAKNTPAIMQDSMLVGQEWGRIIGEEIARKVEEKLK